MATSTSALALPAGISSRRVGISRPKRAAPRARRIPRIIAEASSSSQARDAFVLRASLASSPTPLASLIDDPDASKAFDVVVWGATGFTGALVARHLAKNAPDSLRIAVGGRSDAKLCSLVGSMVESGHSDVLLPMLRGDAADATDMRALARVAKCVVSAAGPYGEHGDVLVGACAAEGTHYADLTGEPGWMRSIIDAHDATAMSTGARIVPCAGFDSVPADVGAFIAATELAKRHPGVRVVKVTSFLTKVLGGFSGGTLATGWRLAEDARERTSFCDVDGLVPGAIEGVTNAAQTPLAFAELEPTYSSDLDAWATTSPFAPCDVKVVRRTVSLLEGAEVGADAGAEVGADRVMPYANLSRFCYEGKLAAFELGTPVGWISSKATAALVEAAVRGAADAETRTSMKAALPKPGEGPPEWFRNAGFWEMRFCAEGEDGKARVWTAMRGGGDPGYSDTARILAEAGVLLASGGGSGPVRRGGVLTPAAAFGDAILRGLEPHGITYTVDGDEPKGVWFSLPKIAKT